MSKLRVIFGLSILVACDVHAIDRATFKFSAPVLSQELQSDLLIDAEGVAAARVLIPTANGVRVVELEHANDKFKKTIKLLPGDRSVFQFQIKPTSGPVFETEYFEFKNESGADAQAELLAQEKEQQEKLADIARVEQNLAALKNSDPANLAKNKNQDMARALLLLSKKERELKDLQASKSTDLDQGAVSE